jgi:hypothetical protein
VRRYQNREIGEVMKIPKGYVLIKAILLRSNLSTLFKKEICRIWKINYNSVDASV